MSEKMIEAPSVDRPVLRRLFCKDKLARVFAERLTEPLHMNVLSAGIALFGSVKMKIAFDLMVRQQYAFSILHAAEQAKAQGHGEVTVIEFGVASGAGMMNMCGIAKRVSKATGVNIAVVGFDTGKRLPVPVEYRNYPEAHPGDDFSMDMDSLRGALFRFCAPEHGKVRSMLRIGDFKETVPGFLVDLPPERPIGFIAVDVDSYSSAKHCLQVLCGPADKYLPRVIIYLDDIGDEYCSPWTGKLLAVDEFNREQPVRKIAPFPMLRSKRLFKNARWIDQIFVAQIYDHATRLVAEERPCSKRIIPNEHASVSKEGLEWVSAE